MSERWFKVKYRQADDPENSYEALEKRIAWRGAIFSAFEGFAVIGDKMILSFVGPLEHYEVEAIDYED